MGAIISKRTMSYTQQLSHWSSHDPGVEVRRLRRYSFPHELQGFVSFVVRIASVIGKSEIRAWGKTDRATCAVHLLVNHCADVAAVFERFLTATHYRRIAERLAGRRLTLTCSPELSALRG